MIRLDRGTLICERARSHESSSLEVMKIDSRGSRLRGDLSSVMNERVKIGWLRKRDEEMDVM